MECMPSGMIHDKFKIVWTHHLCNAYCFMSSEFSVINLLRLLLSVCRDANLKQSKVLKVISFRINV